LDTRLRRTERSDWVDNVPAEQLRIMKRILALFASMVKTPWRRLGGMLYEASDIIAAKGLRLRLNAESPKLTVGHARPLLLSDGKDQDWRGLPRRVRFRPDCAGSGFVRG